MSPDGRTVPTMRLCDTHKRSRERQRKMEGGEISPRLLWMSFYKRSEPILGFSPILPKRGKTLTVVPWSTMSKYRVTFSKLNAWLNPGGSDCSGANQGSERFESSNPPDYKLKVCLLTGRAGPKLSLAEQCWLSTIDTFSRHGQINSPTDLWITQLCVPCCETSP